MCCCEGTQTPVSYVQILISQRNNVWLHGEKLYSVKRSELKFGVTVCIKILTWTYFSFSVRTLAGFKAGIEQEFDT